MLYGILLLRTQYYFTFQFKKTKYIISDASFKGNITRFTNHSCDANASSQVIYIEGKPKIVLFANRDINEGEEITYDYQFPIEADKIVCYCGSSKCIGRMN